ncbi:hypothetical protein [Hansschlegelia sp. KR7-227]|jgi:hypothetical protein|uniref:hypothetical protein n=1 Tax=Hansschlegelia sp. KR7-227 TaxID=3400914 RepID=UPI003BFCE537
MIKPTMRVTGLKTAFAATAVLIAAAALAILATASVDGASSRSGLNAGFLDQGPLER